MIIRHVGVRWFRGIASLDWTVTARFVCLIGPCDATKSTLIDAIELALWPRPTATFDDADFYDADPGKPIEIEVTVGELSERFRREDRFGLELRGWSRTSGLVDEPGDGDEHVLTIKLHVDDSLEPRWTVINDRNVEGKPIGYVDRDALSCTRLGAVVDRHLGWSRGAALARMTDTTEGASRALAEAGRAARAAVGPAQFPKFNETAREVERLAKTFGVKPRGHYEPALDVGAAAFGMGGVSLHDGPVPLRRSGLGTKRLVGMALQFQAMKAGSVALVDEIEHGLEPHRLRSLVRTFCEAVTPSPSRNADAQALISPPSGQCFVTTHSPTAISEVASEALHVVRSRGGTTDVHQVPAELRPLVIKHSEALLAPRVLVCEGRTELGFVRALDQTWSSSGSVLAYNGIALVDGGGENTGRTALSLHGLGYDTAVLCDADKDFTPSCSALMQEGVMVIRWADGKSIEERLAVDLPIEALRAAFALALESLDANTIRTGLNRATGIPVADLQPDPSAWVVDEQLLRSAFGAVSKKQKVNGATGWFKRVDLAEALGRLVAGYLEEMTGTDTFAKLESLHSWVTREP